MKILAYIKRHSVVAATIAIAAVLIMTIAGRVASRNNASQALTDNGTKQVQIIDVSTFRNDASTISADGIVESVAQVDLKSQISAPISVLNVEIGDSVTAGETIAVLQNADIQAQLEQARASLALAQGQYNTGGTSLYSTKKAAIDAMRNAFLAADDILRGQIDQFLFNTAGGDTPLISFVSDYKLQDYLHSTRTDLSNKFPVWKQSIDSLSADSPDADIRVALSESKEILTTVGDLLDNLSSVLSDATKNAPSSTITKIEGWKKTVSTGRTAVSGASTGITSADAALLNALSSHGSPAEAQVSIAEAGVKSLEAQLAKTVIRSPIAGKVASLPLRVGELATPGVLIASVVGGGGLDVKAYISGEDVANIRRDASARIGNGISGTVLSVAPSVNDINKKVEVKILVNNPEDSGLVVGQSVPVSIAMPNSATASSTAPYRLPIQNVKIDPGAAYVFTIGPDSKVVRHDVILDRVEGDFVIVKSGITSDMKIISPVYELEEGQVVEAR